MLPNKKNLKNKIMNLVSKLKIGKLTSEQFFMLSFLGVSAGNYFYNLILGRILGPAQFADAAILITLLLVISFIAMTFQMVTTKFSILFETSQLDGFIKRVYKYASLVGLVIGALLFGFSETLQEVFNTSSSSMFKIFGVGVPFYFMMSVNRGEYQGSKRFKSLSHTYQIEMLSRLIITFGLLYALEIESSMIIAIGIALSFVLGLFPFNFKRKPVLKPLIISKKQVVMIRRFFLLTAFYELTQIIINNSDILLVKHYFDSMEAGLYASLALIGRVVYFLSWTFIMLLLPKVIGLKKEGKNPSPILFRYVGYISIISILIITACVSFPQFIISIMFGGEFTEISPLLWKYALATSMFAVSNIFAYYYLSLDKYVPVILSAIIGLLQVFLIVFFHDSLDQVVKMQIVAMIILLVIQVSYFMHENYKQSRINLSV
jgi:O-antigen/teichoic acid export membrane protein